MSRMANTCGGRPPQRAWLQTSRSPDLEISAKLTRAELRARLLFEGGKNPAAEFANLCIRQRRFAALKRHAHEQRIFPCRNILAAEKIRRLDRCNFRYVERSDDSRHISEMGSIGE